jgi:hypothetical protein
VREIRDRDAKNHHVSPITSSFPCLERRSEKEKEKEKKEKEKKKKKQKKKNKVCFYQAERGFHRTEKRGMSRLPLPAQSTTICHPATAICYGATAIAICHARLRCFKNRLRFFKNRTRSNQKNINAISNIKPTVQAPQSKKTESGA